MSRRRPKPIFTSRRRRRVAPGLMLAICVCLFLLGLLALGTMIVLGGS